MIHICPQCESKVVTATGYPLDTVACGNCGTPIQVPRGPSQHAIGEEAPLDVLPASGPDKRIQAVPPYVPPHDGQRMSRTAAPAVNVRHGRSPVIWIVTGVAACLVLLIGLGLAGAWLASRQLGPAGRPQALVVVTAMESSDGPRTPDKKPNRDLDPPVPGDLGEIKLSAPFSAMTFAPEPGFLTIADNHGRHLLWDIKANDWKDSIAGGPSGVQHARSTFLQYSPDRRWLVGVGDQQTILLWIPRLYNSTVARALSLRGRAVAFSPDGRTLAVLATDGSTVKFCDLMTSIGRPFDVHDFLMPDKQLQDRTLTSLQITPDGQRLFAAGTRTLGDKNAERADALWDIATGKELEIITAFQREPVDATVLMSADGRRLALACVQTSRPRATVKLWDLPGRRPLPELTAPAAVTGLNFAPDGETLAVASADGSVTLWDTSKGARLAQVRAGRPGEVSQVEFASEGQLLATNLANGVRLWDLEAILGRRLDSTSRGLPPPTRAAVEIRPEDVREVRTITTDQQSLGGLAVSPDSKLLATATKKPAADHRSTGQVKFWELATGKLVDSVSGDAPVLFSGDGKCLVHGFKSGGMMTLKLCDARTRRLFPGISPWGMTGSTGLDAVITADGRWLVIADGQRLAVLDLVNRFHENREETPQLFQALAAGPVGLVFAGAREGGNDVLVFRGHCVKPWLTCSGHTAPVSAVAYSPDGQLLVSGSHDRTVRLWDPVGGKPLGILNGHTGPIGGVAFSPDGRVLASVGPDGVRLWDAPRQKQLLALPAPAEATEGRLAFTRDGRRLVAGWDKTVRVWSIARLTGLLDDQEP